MSAGKRAPADQVRLVPIMASHALALACGIVGVKVTTWLVPPAAYGRYGVFVSLAPIGMWIIHAGLVKYMARHWAAAVDQVSLLATAGRAFVRKLPWLAAAAAAAIAIASPQDLLPGFLLLFVTAALLSWTAIVQAALQAGRHHWRDFAVTSVGAVTRSFAPPLLFRAFAGSATALQSGYFLHALAVAGVATLAVRTLLPPGRKAAGQPAPDSVYEGPLFAVLAVNGWAMAGLQRWVVAGFLGASAAGFVALATNIATLVPTLLGSIALQYFQPGIFAAPVATAADRRALARQVDRIALAHAVLSLAGLAALRLAMPWLVGRLINESYRPAIELMLPTGAAMLALATGWFYHALLLAGRRERACGPAELAAAAVLVLGSVGAARSGLEWWSRWCLVSPLVPWLVNRPIARHHFLKLDAGPAPGPGR